MARQSFCYLYSLMYGCGVDSNIGIFECFMHEYQAIAQTSCDKTCMWYGLAVALNCLLVLFNLDPSSPDSMGRLGCIGGLF